MCDTSTASPPSSVQQKYFNASQVVDFLNTFAGFNLTKSGLYQLTMRNAIPHRKGPGGRLLFEIAKIRQWVEGGSEGGSGGGAA